MTGPTAPGAAAAIALARQLLASCSVALLDMNCTFMFGGDRLGPDESFGDTYRAAGGQLLSAEEVTAAVLACVVKMRQLYEDPTRIDDFPGVFEVLADLTEAAGLPEAERYRLVEVLARYELGRVPVAHAHAVRQLARTHRLGLVANIWAPKDLWLAELARVGLRDSFTVLVFSSDSRSIKPSRRLFVEALRGIGIEGSGPHPNIVFIGDSLRCDIRGAQHAGLRTIWINPSGAEPPATTPQPDAWVPDLLALVPSDPPGRPAPQPV